MRLVLVLLLLCPQVIQAAAPKDHVGQIETALTALLVRYALPGAVLLVAQDGEVVLEVELGLYSGSSRIPVASASKWLTATLLMRLVDQGVLRWSDRIADHVDDVPADKADLTLEQLFSLTSGIPGGDAGSGHPCLGDRSVSLEACARQILALPLTATPGSVFDYGGNSMQVAGWIAEVVSGRDFNDLLRDELTEPLGMSRTDMGLFPGLNVSNPRVGGGAFSSADDYLRLLLMHQDFGRLDGRRWLDRGSVADSEHVRTTGTQTLNSPLPDAAGYALGKWVLETDAVAGSTVLTSPGGFGFTPWIDRRRGIAAVLAIQANLDQFVPVRDDVLEIIDLVALVFDQDADGIPFADFGGWWWNPAEAGSGFTIEQRANHALFAAWYTYDDDGAQQWLVLTEGAWETPARWRGQLFGTRYTGSGAFSSGVDPTLVDTFPLGEATLEFSSAGHGVLTAITDQGSRQIAIERFSF